MTTVLQEDQAYRRGLVLGLTMAEIAILLIFCLLLALAAMLIVKDETIAALEAQNQDLSTANALLEKKVDLAVAQSGQPDQFDDEFDVLELIAKAETLEDQNAALREQMDRLTPLKNALEQSSYATDPTDLNELQEDLKTLEEAKEAGQRGQELAQALKDADLPVDPDALPSALAEAKAARDAIESAGTGTPEEIIKRLQDADILEEENQLLQERLVKIQAQNDAIGKGTELPSCWVQEGTTKPDYIFDVALTGSGLIVRDRKLPHRAADQSRLPINVDFGRELTERQFLAQAKPLFEWSVRRGCRFFVLAYDLTPTEAKKLYKRRDRILGQRFYRYPVQNDPWE